MRNFSDLPEEIMLDIFTLLPTESILDSKLVAKTWRKVIHHPSFNQLHSNILLRNLNSTAESGKFRFICRMNDLSLSYLEYDDEVSSYRIMKLDWIPPFKLYSILGSCNGLICINGLPSHYPIVKSTRASYVACICNPITGESITLPELGESTNYHLVDFMSSGFDYVSSTNVAFMSSGFGYVASTNEYKVVRMYTFWKKTKVAHIEVYTLGSGEGWRDAGNIEVSDSLPREDAVFVDGFLYWNFRKGRIRAFDLANEVFVELDESYNEDFWGGVLGGHYCGVHFSKGGKNSDVWQLKKKEDDSFSWIKAFSLIGNAYTLSLALTSGDMVLCYSNSKLHLYDPKSCSFKMLGDVGTGIYYAVPHVNTLVSLKAFGEENTKNTGSRWKQYKLDELS